MYTHKKPAPAARGRRSIALFLAADILAFLVCSALGRARGGETG